MPALEEEEEGWREVVCKPSVTKRRKMRKVEPNRKGVSHSPADEKWSQIKEQREARIWEEFGKNLGSVELRRRSCLSEPVV